MKIAVFVDRKGNVVPYHASGILALYVLDNNHWACIKKMLMGPDEGTNIAEVRSRILAIKSEIGDCKVFIVEKIKSLPIAMFDGYGITVWTHQGIPEKVFDYIKEQEENRVHEKKSNCCDSPHCKSTCSLDTKDLEHACIPVATGNLEEGNYKIDLARILKNDRSLNSKQILFPFFKNTVFEKLEIICEHIPKWFETAFEELNLEILVHKTSDGLCKAIVTHKK